MVFCGFVVGDFGFGGVDVVYMMKYVVGVSWFSIIILWDLGMSLVIYESEDWKVK